ncbi:MAG: ABC transporter substrate-binding protein [Desulfobacterales bacterium]|nr:ABC transporter substrate-binding protein [Desulfobacterales bacterium]
MNRIFVKWGALWLAAAMVWTAGLGHAAEPISMAYRLKWLFNVSTAGDLWADTEGIFSGAGLNVEVKAGGPERDAIKELELGHTEFGVASADQVIRAAAKGSPVVVIAQIFQINPLQWIYRASAPPITTLGDLRGHTIGITYGGNDETIMRTLLAKAGLDEKDVSLFSVRYDFTPFYQKRAEIWPIYRNSQGITIAHRMANAGDPVRYLDPAAFGVRFVANSVVTSRAMMEERPETAVLFVRALCRAWEEALDPANEEKALAVIARFDKDSPPDLLKEQLDVTRQLVRPDPGVAVGTIDVAAWRQTEQVMRDQGLIQAPVQVERRLFPFGAPSKPQ